MHAFEHQIEINSGPYPPIAVNGSPSFMCAGLNVEFLAGYRAADFALASHTHNTSGIISGTFDPLRLGDDVEVGRFLKCVTGPVGQWEWILAADISNATAIGRTLITSATQNDARVAIDAAKAVHKHHADDVDRGVFKVERLGSGAASTRQVLTGEEPGKTSEWKELGYADVNGAVGYNAWTLNRVPVFVAAGTLGVSPILCKFSQNFVEVISGYGLAVADDQFYIDGVKLPGPPSDTQLYGLRAGGATGAAWEEIETGGSTPPITPADSVKVWVVNDSGTAGDWYTFTGDNVYAGE